MDAFDDPALDALMRRAAPRADAPALADRVLAAALLRRRRMRLARLALAAAAGLALAAAIGLLLGTHGGPAPAPAPIARAEPAPAAHHVEGFAAAVPRRTDSTHRVMMARANGKLAVFARPKAWDADALAPAPRAMVAWVSED